MGDLPQDYPRRGTTDETRRERDKVTRLVKEAGPPVKTMQERLRKYSKVALAAFAHEIIKSGRAPKLGHLPPRYRKAMIAWFCKYAPDFVPEIPPPKRRAPAVGRAGQGQELAAVGVPESPEDDFLLDWPEEDGFYE
jgi:hypothetical protein